MKDFYERYWERRARDYGTALSGVPSAKLEFISDLLPQNRGLGKVLDVGCGDGSLMAYIHEADLVSGVTSVGVDFSLSALRRSSRQFGLCLADACRLPFQDETFDLITCKETLEHIPDHKSALREIAPRLQKTGANNHRGPQFHQVGQSAAYGARTLS